MIQQIHELESRLAAAEARVAFLEKKPKFELSGIWEGEVPAWDYDNYESCERAKYEAELRNCDFAKLYMETGEIVFVGEVNKLMGTCDDCMYYGAVLKTEFYKERV